MSKAKDAIGQILYLGSVILGVVSLFLPALRVSSSVSSDPGTYEEFSALNQEQVSSMFTANKMTGAFFIAIAVLSLYFMFVKFNKIAIFVFPVYSVIEVLVVLNNANTFNETLKMNISDISFAINVEVLYGVYLFGVAALAAIVSAVLTIMQYNKYYN